MTHLKSTYAGLAGILTALIFLQISAAIFIFGAEVNAALRQHSETGEKGARSALPDSGTPAPQS